MENLSLILQDLEQGKISVDDAEQQVLDLFAVMWRSEQLCQHDRSVTNRICDDCGSVITYVPDDELA